MTKKPPGIEIVHLKIITAKLGYRLSTNCY